MPIYSKRGHLVGGGCRNGRQISHRNSIELLVGMNSQNASHEVIKSRLRYVDRYLKAIEAKLAETNALLEASRPGGPIVLRWPRAEGVRDNWGDKLNPVLVEALSGRQALHASDIRPNSANKTYLVIGSGLRNMKAGDVVWGMGFISIEDRPSARPFRVCAVRGPHTKKKLLSQGIACPEVFGDPALLFPLFYNKPVELEYDLGIIQHFREVGFEPLPFESKTLKVRVILITGSIEDTIDAIRSCKQIVSSSLHGLIAAHAYGICATWIKFSNRPLGDDFKFKDYFASIGLDDVQPYEINADTSYDHLVGDELYLTPKVDLVQLILACPFIQLERQKELISLMSWAYPNGFKPRYTKLLNF